ncbi:DeoR family transcriptional regulator [Roseobacter cerasinus]|uniref:DeoR family transcriptional regulator n=1 Tax=Roseobacter cerasinus TaxID=2602289 RepID=A0A640VQL6_9RHOB|nr:WYL domain-containing protein [Roseobacter cerasinus]GFE49165.1 DeoR family transcriptional regulator [Roseobacter cerasinus]
MNIRLRQDAIIRFLRRNGTTTIDALAEDVGASRRTVLRDISALRDEGFVIHSDVGRGGGLQLDPQSMQTTTRLSVPEVFALLISVAALRATRSLPFSDLADTGLAKIEKALPSDKVKDLRALLDCLHIGELSPLQDLSGMGSTDRDLLPAFEAAFLGRQLLRFDYVDAQDRRTQRTVEPQAMLILPPLWYLVAWDPARDGFRHFRMDRISQPAALDDTNFRRRHVPFEDDVCPFTELTR